MPFIIYNCLKIFFLFLLILKVNLSFCQEKQKDTLNVYLTAGYQFLADRTYTIGFGSKANFTDKFFDSAFAEILYEKFNKPKDLDYTYILTSKFGYVWKFISIGFGTRQFNPFKIEDYSFEFAPELGVTYKYFNLSYSYTAFKLGDKIYPTDSNKLFISIRYPIFNIKL